MRPSPDLDTILSRLSGLVDAGQPLRPLLVHLLAELPLPHSDEIKDLHAALDKTIRAAEAVRSHSRNWAHLLDSNRRRA